MLNHSTKPKGSATDVLNKGVHSRFLNDLMNLAYQRDTAYFLLKACVLIIAICIIATVLIATTYNYKTYVVRVDNTTGEVETGGQLKATNYQPREAEIKHFLGNFILDTRTVPLDPVQFNSSITRAQHFMTSEASNKLAALLQHDNPASKLGHVTVQPTIKSIQLQPGSKSTYQVRWTEDEFSISGNATNKKINYVALFAVIVNPPTKESELLINPLGLKIKDLTISVESGSTANSATGGNP